MPCSRFSSRLRTESRDHLVHAEVFADVPQKVCQSQGPKPVGVVDHDRLRLAGAEVDDPLRLPADARDVGLQHLRCEERPLRLPAAGVADEAGSAAHDRDRLVAGELHPAQPEQLDQPAQVQAVGGGVEAAVEDELLGRQQLAELGVGGLVDQATPLQLRVDVFRHV